MAVRNSVQFSHILENVINFHFIIKHLSRVMSEKWVFMVELNILLSVPYTITALLEFTEFTTPCTESGTRCSEFGVGVTIFTTP